MSKTLETKYSNMKPFSEYACWFKRNLESSSEFDVVNLPTREVIGTFNPEHNQYQPAANTSVEIHLETVLSEFKNYTTRPEYMIGCAVNLSDTDVDELSETYESLLTGVALIRAYEAGKDPDTAIKSIEHCLNWLRSTDFYSAPASTIYHESYPGGLLYHTLQVYNQMCLLHSCKHFRKIEYHSATLVALTHDWCKIGLYSIYMKNVKNEETGKWEKIPGYKHDQKGVPLGHGVTSMYIASKFFRLSTEEAVAIRWHMNSWNVAPNEMNDLQLANETYPLVHLIQFADQLSITKYR